MPDDGLCHICRREPLEQDPRMRITTCKSCDATAGRRPARYCMDCRFSVYDDGPWYCDRPRITDVVDPVTGGMRSERSVSCASERRARKWWQFWLSRDRCGPEASFFMPDNKG